VARTDVPARLESALDRLKTAGYLRKWLILGAVIGVIAGLGAVVFVQALHLTSRLFLTDLAGYSPPLPIGEGNTLGRTAGGRPARSW
jgi:CIC family chloride channel protein